MSEAHRIAGQKGGNETKRLYGVDFFSQIGKLGGRPRWEITLEKDRQLRAAAHRKAVSRTHRGERA
jgi:hypothetical protein